MLRPIVECCCDNSFGLYYMKGKNPKENSLGLVIKELRVTRIRLLFETTPVESRAKGSGAGLGFIGLRLYFRWATTQE